MSSSVVLRGRGPLSRSVRDARAAGGEPMAMTAGLLIENNQAPPPGLAHHVRLRAPSSAEDIQLDLRARPRGRTDP